MLSPFFVYGGVLLNTNITVISIFILHLLVVITLLRMLNLKMKAVRSKELRRRDFILTKDSDMNDELLNVSNHLRNLFQLPVLFQILLMLYFFIGEITFFVAILSVLFALSRVIHSYIHLMTKNVRNRFLSFLTGGIIVLILWGNLFVSLLTR